MRLLFIGESWLGSSARSLREALTMQEDVVIEGIDEDHFLPRRRGFVLRVANRLLEPWHRAALERAIRVAAFRSRPDAAVVYKGTGVNARLITQLQRGGCPVINIFPDNSPHAHGRKLREAVGLCDLVISTKPFHPALWEPLYGYHNPCECVPHGYDPHVHLWSKPAPSHDYDVALCATWRPEYHRLMRSFAKALGTSHVSVAIGGNGWVPHADELPSHWQLIGPRTGRAYGEFLRSAKIAVAPVTRDVVIHGLKQPGDEDSTRTYELAAAHCFFLHQRTDYVKAVFDEHNEVPLWTDATQLASLVLRWLPDESGRRALAAAAHARAVPAYSIPQRAAEIMKHVAQAVERRSVEKCAHD